jgi:prolipoprotein diacylglyceryltransferase
MIKVILKQIMELLLKLSLFFVLIYYFLEDRNLADSLYITILFLIINCIFKLISYLIKKLRNKH